METKEIHDHVADLTAGEYLDYDTYYTGTEDTLFRDDEDVKPVTRTFAVDEDMLAQFVELGLEIVPKVELLRHAIAKTESKLDFVMRCRIKTTQATLDQYEGALEDAKQERLPKDEFMAIVARKFECLRDLKLQWAEYKALIAQVKAQKSELFELQGPLYQLAGDQAGACWARWFQMEDPEAWLSDYLENDGKPGWDSEDYDNQAHLKDDGLFAMECLGDEHVLEMIHGEGLVWQDQKPVKENPYLPRSSWDFRVQKEMESKAKLDQYHHEEDNALFAAFEAEEEQYQQQFVGE